jgi:hypothetical protein
MTINRLRSYPWPGSAYLVSADQWRSLMPKLKLFGGLADKSD